MANLQSKCGKEEFITYLTEIFETPSSELPTSDFPALILEKTGIEVEFNDLGSLFLSVVGKDLRSRPRKLAVVKEIKPPRIKKPTVLNITFGDGEDLVVDLKKKVETVSETEAETESGAEIRVVKTPYRTLAFVNPPNTEVGDTDPLANNHLTPAFTEALVEANTTFEFVTVDYTNLESVNTTNND